jgi:cytosine/adenosine deaminase-related metal-dependent hydrolase
MELTLEGTIIYGDDFEPINGRLTIEDGIIRDIEERKNVPETIIAPCFVNAHTHIGDSILKDPPYLPLEELVQPPNGLKHRVLRETPYNDLVASMKATIDDMIKTGTCAFADFREGGLEGVLALKEALGSCDIDARIFGRHVDASMDYLDHCDGTGISSTNDIASGLVKDIKGKTREKGKKFVIHAGEKDASDILPAIELEPDFLVHLTHAGKKELRAVADAGIPVIVCVRSNFITNSGIPPVQKMLDEGILVAAGTDNVMFNSPSMFPEMEFLAKTNLRDDRQVFKFCTLNGAQILGIDSVLGSIKKGKTAKLMVLNRNSGNLYGTKNPLGSLVRRARPDDIVKIT